MFEETVVCFGKRRVQQNRYTYMVPLPTPWIRTLGIKKGDCVEIELIDDQNLKIVPAAASKLRPEQAESPNKDVLRLD